ncbi:hypothetical protein P2318_13655 [Myxococcaceae bacterium GXIMD 01537]
MLSEHRSEYLGNVEKAVSGAIVDAGPDHLTVHDIGGSEDVTLRIDDRTRYAWVDARHQGRLTDTGLVKVGYYIAGGVHVAADVLVLEPGDGEPITGRIEAHVR